MDSKLAQAKMAQAMARAARLPDSGNRQAAADDSAPSGELPGATDANDNQADALDPGVFDSLGYDPCGFGPNEWLEANLATEARYLFLSRASIRDMCLDLRTMLTKQIHSALDDRLNHAEPQTAAPDREAAAAMLAAELAGDMSWLLTWEQAKHLVEPYAKGSWLLAQVQAHEEARLVTIYASELTRQIARYVQNLVFRAYGVKLPTQSADGKTPQPLYWVDDITPSGE